VKKERSSKRIGRKRRAAGWTLLLLGLPVAGVWVASGWWRFSLGTTHRWLGCSRGCVVYGRSTAVGSSVTAKCVFQPQAPGDVGFEWWFDWGPKRGFQIGETVFYGVTRDSDYGEYREFAALLWPVPLLLWAAGVPVLRSGILARRRAHAGLCGKCGYSLAGLVAGAPCPECGKTTAVS
jgi:hypothetical protein